MIVQEPTGCHFFFSLDPEISAEEILENFADRAAIEQDFHDVKEVWGAGQQQVRHLWANIGAWHLNLWMHTLVELWAWHKPMAQICDRRASPWDDPSRRPSHADRRKALRRWMLREEYSAIARRQRLPRKSAPSSKSCSTWPSNVVIFGKVLLECSQSVILAVWRLQEPDASHEQQPAQRPASIALARFCEIPDASRDRLGQVRDSVHPRLGG